MKLTSFLLIALLCLLLEVQCYGQNKSDSILLRIETLNRQKDSLNSAIISIDQEIKTLFEKLQSAKDQEYRGELTVSTEENASLRKSPSPLSDKIINLKNGDTVKALTYENGYYKVLYGEYIGYISEIFIRKENRSINSPSSKTTTTRTTDFSSKTTRKKTSRIYHKGPRGGCFYYNSSGNKTYVDRKLCN